MPPLEDPRLESLAQALARGLSARTAAGEAGFNKAGPSNKRRSERADIAERVSEPKFKAACAGEAGPLMVIQRLFESAEMAMAMNSGAAAEAARRMYADAAALMLNLRSYAPLEPWPEMSREEWMERYGAKDEP